MLRIFLLRRKSVKKRIFYLNLAYKELLKGPKWFLYHDQEKNRNIIKLQTISQRLIILLKEYTLNLINIFLKYNNLKKDFISAFNVGSSASYWYHQLGLKEHNKKRK